MILYSMGWPYRILCRKEGPCRSLYSKGRPCRSMYSKGGQYRILYSIGGPCICTGREGHVGHCIVREDYVSLYCSGRP